jgi:hypothetical protein
MANAEKLSSITQNILALQSTFNKLTVGGVTGWVGIVDAGFYGGLILTLLFVWRGRITLTIVFGT